MVIKLKKFNTACQFMLVSLILCISPLRMFNMYNMDNSYINFILNAALIVLALLVIICNLPLLMKPFVFEAMVVFVVLLHFLLFFENREYIRFTFDDYWIYSIVLFLCVYIMDFKTLEKTLFFSASVVLLFDFLLIQSPLYLRMITEYKYGGVGAVFSYSVLFPGIVFMHMSKKIKILIVPSLVAVYLIGIYGSNRMALLSYIIYFLYSIFLENGKLTVKKILMILAFLITSILLLWNLKSIAVWLINMLGKENYTPRILSLLSSNSFFSNSARNDITSFFISKALSFHGLIGYGVNGDRVINTLYNHQYAHNIIIQILIEFGIIGGSILIILMIGMVVNVVKRKTVYNNILPVIFFTQIFALFISGTFWTSNFFWMFIAVCLSVIFPIRKNDPDLMSVTV